MTVVAVDIGSYVAELSDGAFEAFCDDISAMFNAEVACTRQHIGTGTVKEVRKHFKRLAAVHNVQATGALDGTFHLFFDQGGLFVLSGVVVMLPEDRIREEVKQGSIDDAENLKDAAREVGNLLVGSWDRIFRAACQGHEHFLKTGTFIGKPWENPDEVPLAETEELLFVVYEMTVASYPSFCCAAVFPRAVLRSSTPEAVAPGAAQGVEDTPTVESREVTSQAPVAAPAEAASALEPEPATEQDAAKDSPAVAAEPHEPVEEPAPPETTDPAEACPIPEDIRPTVEAVVGDVEDAAPQVPAPPVVEPGQKAATGYIDGMFNDLVEYSCDTGLAELLTVPAQDIMVSEVVWSTPDDTVQDVVAKMQQHNTGYVLIGRDEVLEGLVSNSNILGAVSPYLRPMFAKWRRPEDDATLEIKVKWIMSRPVRTVRPDTTLGSMIESMRRYGGRCLPVVDSQTKVQGIVTVFDILLRVLEAEKNFSWEGRPPQAPPLLI